MTTKTKTAAPGKVGHETVRYRVVERHGDGWSPSHGVFGTERGAVLRAKKAAYARRPRPGVAIWFEVERITTAVVRVFPVQGADE